eukprot:s2_g26.t1
MAAYWFGAASAHRDLASEDVTCLSSMKVIDNILSDAEAQAVITDLEVQRSGSARRTPQVGAELKKSRRNSSPALWKCWSQWDYSSLSTKSRAMRLWRSGFGKP